MWCRLASASTFLISCFPMPMFWCCRSTARATIMVSFCVWAYEMKAIMLFWVFAMYAGSCATVYVLLKVSCSCSPQKRCTSFRIVFVSLFVVGFVIV